jgi:cell division septum initiation protein DivIVA
VAKSIQEWISEGEQIYNAALEEYRSLEKQIDELEQKLAAKQEEVNRVAALLNKPPVEGTRRLAAQLVSDHGPNSVPNSHATIARALTGNFGGGGRR